MKLFKWSLKDYPVLTYWDFEKTLHYVKNNVKVFRSTYGFTIEILDKEIRIENYYFDKEDFIQFCKDVIEEEKSETCKTLYVIYNDNLRKMVFWKERQYKLCQVQEDWAPTLLINGIVMHTVKKDPIEDALTKVQFLRKGYVLDTCTGLGYTVYAALSKGVKYVLTTEIDEFVLELSTFNRYSSALGSIKVDIINESILDILPVLKDSSFSSIIHDPPRLTSETGDLYSTEIYKEFYRILTKGGTLFHYTGATGSKFRGLNILKGVIKRLKNVGFEIIKVIEGFGVFAIKP